VDTGNYRVEVKYVNVISYSIFHFENDLLTPAGVKLLFDRTGLCIL